MAVFRTVNLLCLALSLSSAEAMDMADPMTCYVLDAVLLLYCIVFTALYFRMKFARQLNNTVVDEPLYEGLKTDQITSENYETLELKGNQPPRRKPAQQEESQYESLKSQTNDEYQEIKKKSKPRKSKKKSKEPGADGQNDAGQAIEMKSIPPLPSRS